MIERCTDYRRIQRFPDWRINISSDVYYLMETDGDKDLGVWTFHPWGSSHKFGLLIHASLGSGCKGKDAKASARSAFYWIFTNTDCREIWAAIPNDKRPAQFMASWAGMKYQYKDDNKRYYRIGFKDVIAPDHPVIRKAAYYGR